MASTQSLRQSAAEVDEPTSDGPLDGLAAPAVSAGPRPEASFGPIAMHHVRRGHGKPLLLLHGIGGSWQSWQPIIDELARERAVIALDLPGFGRSGGLAVPLSVPHLADQVTAFLRGHGLVGVDVAGVSMGGRLALELSRRGVVGTTVALDPEGFWTSRQRLLFYWSVRAADRVLRSLRGRLPGLLARRSFRSLLLLHVSPRPWRLEPDIVVDELNRRASGPSLVPSLRSITFGPPPLGLGASASSRKIVLGWGRHDRLCRPGQARRVLQLFPTARLHWFEQAGHVPLWDCPEATARLILDSTA